MHVRARSASTNQLPCRNLLKLSDAINNYVVLFETCYIFSEYIRVDSKGHLAEEGKSQSAT